MEGKDETDVRDQMEGLDCRSFGFSENAVTL